MQSTGNQPVIPFEFGGRLIRQGTYGSRPTNNHYFRIETIALFNDWKFVIMLGKVYLSEIFWGKKLPGKIVQDS